MSSGDDFREEWFRRNAAAQQRESAPKQRTPRAAPARKSSGNLRTDARRRVNADAVAESKELGTNRPPASPARSPATPPAGARTRGRTSQNRRGSRSQAQRTFKRLSGRVSGGVLLAEYFVGAILICWNLFTKGGSQGYTATIADIMARLTALTAVFFVLFLLAGNQNAGKAAAWFGLLIDVAIFLNAAQSGVIGTIGDVVAGKGTGVDQATLTAATTVAEPTPQQMPDE